MGLPAYMVASTMKSIMAQRLSRRICPDCKKPHDPTPEEIAVFKEHKVDLPKDIKLYKGEGCGNCGGSGFKGRVGLHELLIMSDALRAQCLKDVAAENLRAIAQKEGMRTILQDGLEKVKLGLTTVRETLGGAAEGAEEKKEAKK
jgi:type IV pilus assembly protein PilB